MWRSFNPLGVSFFTFATTSVESFPPRSFRAYDNRFASSATTTLSGAMAANVSLIKLNVALQHREAVNVAHNTQTRRS